MFQWICQMYCIDLGFVEIGFKYIIAEFQSIGKGMSIELHGI